MKPVYAVKKDDTFIALFEEKSAAYQLRTDKRQELPNNCYVSVDKHMLFADLSDRERLRS